MKPAIVLTILLLSTPSNSEESKPISFSQLPTSVVNELSDLTMTQDIRQIEEILVNGKKLYEIETESNNQFMDITLSPDGQVFEIKRQSTFADLPLNAKQAIQEKFELLKVNKVEHVQLNYHEVVGTLNDVEVELKVYANGKITVRTADDD